MACRSVLLVSLTASHVLAFKPIQQHNIEIVSPRAKPSLLALRGGNDMVTKMIVPTIATGLANGMFFSGLPEVINKRTQGSLGDFNPLPMPVIFANCLGWLIYSFLKKDVFIMLSNAPGLLLSVWYVLTVVKLADPAVSKQVEQTMMLLTAVHTALAVWCCFNADRATMTTVYGIACNIILLMYYGAPLSTIGTVLKSRSSASIYLPTVLVNGVNGAFFSIYALAINDMLLLAPNAIGAALAAVQVLLCVAFPS